MAATDDFQRGSVLALGQDFLTISLCLAGQGGLASYPPDSPEQLGAAWSVAATDAFQRGYDLVHMASVGLLTSYLLGRATWRRIPQTAQNSRRQCGLWRPRTPSSGAMTPCTMASQRAAMPWTQMAMPASWSTGISPCRACSTFVWPFSTVYLFGYNDFQESALIKRMPVCTFTGATSLGCSVML